MLLTLSTLDSIRWTWMPLLRPYRRMLRPYPVARRRRWLVPKRTSDCFQTTTPPPRACGRLESSTGRPPTGRSCSTAATGRPRTKTLRKTAEDGDEAPRPAAVREMAPGRSSAAGGSLQSAPGGRDRTLSTCPEF